MEMPKIINKHTILLFIGALLINLIFLFIYYKNCNYTRASILGHGEIGYNVYKYNSLQVNPIRGNDINEKTQKEQRLVDYDEVDHSLYGPPTHGRVIQDTFAYGLLLGLLWKITGRPSFLYIEILQILIFSLLMFLYYSLALILFNNARIAFWCGVAHLLFFPLYYLNVHPVRDIWAYYGVLVLLWIIAAYFFNKLPWYVFLCGSIFVTICQFMRPMMICNIAAGVLIIACAAFFKKIPFDRSIKAISMLVGANILFFWIPFSTYNKYTYNRYFVGPTGQWLIEGMGEYENKWGFQLDDVWYGKFMKEKYNLDYGTPECEEKAKELFFECLKEDPWPFITSMLKRFPHIVLPGLTWNDYYNTWYTLKYPSWWAKIKALMKYPFTSLGALYDFVGRQVYMRLFLLFGYLGLFILLWRRQYFFAALILIVGILPSYSCIPSHIEYRYIIPYYGFFSLLTGYALFQTRDFIKTKRYLS